MRLSVVLRRLAPDLAAYLWRVRRVQELSHDVRGAMADVLGHEAAHRGLGPDDEPNQYGRDLDALVEALGLKEQP